MTDHLVHHPPDPPQISVATLLDLLHGVVPGWQVGIEDAVSLHLFDELGEPRGYIDIVNAQVVLVDGIDGETSFRDA